MEIKDTIILAMHGAGAPLKASEIAQMTGIPKADVDQAIKELRKEGLITSPRRSYYLPKM